MPETFAPTVDPYALGGDITVYDALDSTNGTTKALSANMGRVLNENHTALAERVAALEEAGTGSGSTVTITTATEADIVALFN